MSLNESCRRSYPIHILSANSYHPEVSSWPNPSSSFPITSTRSESPFITKPAVSAHRPHRLLPLQNQPGCLERKLFSARLQGLSNRNLCAQQQRNSIVQAKNTQSGSFTAWASRSLSKLSTASPPEF